MDRVCNVHISILSPLLSGMPLISLCICYTCTVVHTYDEGLYTNAYQHLWLVLVDNHTVYIISVSTHVHTINTMSTK